MKEMKKQIYKWQGEKVKVIFGNCRVKENKDKPLWWYNYECSLGMTKSSAIIPVIKITTKDGYSFMIANHFGIGVYKLQQGGWPDCRHYSVDGKFSTNPRLKQDYFEPEEFAKHEADRNKWQEREYPKEYESIKGLKAMINK